MSISTEFVATGRRKTSVATVRLRPGNGAITINGRQADDYLTTVPLQNTIRKPLEIANQIGVFDILVRATGGGLVGQAGAIRLAISRALLEVNPELRPELKAGGLLTRDPRMKERKKSGQPGARKRFQFSKR